MLALLLAESALLLPASSRYTRPALPPLWARAEAASSHAALLPPPDDLSDHAMLSIVLSETSDEQTNELVWKYLGYTRGPDGEWDASAVFPNWRKKYPTPPDLIGVTRTYSREVDEPVLRAVQSLQRSVPTEHKDNLRQCLKPLGWAGFKMEGLTPNMTRRAQAHLSTLPPFCALPLPASSLLPPAFSCLHSHLPPCSQVAQWLIYYRNALHGVPLEELRRRKEARAAAEAAATQLPPTGTTKQSVI
ncbi:MAG: hypothetical protein SGPRY_006081 [Prymnesium sp.]